LVIVFVLQISRQNFKLVLGGHKKSIRVVSAHAFGKAKPRRHDHDDSHAQCASHKAQDAAA
jgi:hypothetical protein